MTREAVMEELKTEKKPEGAPSQTVVALPVSEGQELEVEIISRGDKGDGIARVDGFVVFVPGADSGVKARIRIKNVVIRGRFAVGELIRAETEVEKPEEEIPIPAAGQSPVKEDDNGAVFP